MESCDVATYQAGRMSGKIDLLRAMSRHFNYRTFGDGFHMIEEKFATFPVIVRYHENDADHAIDDLLNVARWHFSRKLQRSLQQYVVELCRKDAQDLSQAGALCELTDGNGNALGLYVLNEKDGNGEAMYENGRGINRAFCQGSAIII